MGRMACGYISGSTIHHPLHPPNIHLPSTLPLPSSPLRTQLLRFFSPLTNHRLLLTLVSPPNIKHPLPQHASPALPSNPSANAVWPVVV